MTKDRKQIGGCMIALEQGNLTAAAVDAIVNAANHTLLGGGGVDGAIHRKGGPEILAACRRLRTEEWPDGLPTGEAVITTAGRLPARYVIHTVGPVYSGDPEVPRLLAACHDNSLALARTHGLRTVAFPAISTGVYGYPLAEAAPIALATTAAHLERHPGALARGTVRALRRARLHGIRGRARDGALSLAATGRAWSTGSVTIDAGGDDELSRVHLAARRQSGDGSYSEAPRQRRAARARRARRRLRRHRDVAALRDQGVLQPARTDSTPTPRERARRPVARLLVAAAS